MSDVLAGMTRAEGEALLGGVVSNIYQANALVYMNGIAVARGDMDRLLALAALGATVLEAKEAWLVCPKQQAPMHWPDLGRVYKSEDEAQDEAWNLGGMGPGAWVKRRVLVLEGD